MNEKNFETTTIKNPKMPLLFCCDHASNEIPKFYNNLGLNKSTLQKHISYDLGAKFLTKTLAKKFQTNYILARYSRLFIDLNRDPSHKNLIPQYSDEIEIIGNKNISLEEKKYRIKHFHRSYHEKISNVLSDMDKKFNCKTTLICVHSFTPSLKNKENRPWHIGLLYRKDKRIFHEMYKHLKNIKTLNIGKNLPYSGYEDVNYTMTYHGENKHRPFISIELRNDSFKKYNKKRLNNIIKSITVAIYKSQVALGEPYKKKISFLNKNILMEK